MWHGRTWLYIMPEVFENNPHPRQKVTQQDIEDIQNRYENLKESVSSIAKDYIA